MVVRGGRKRLSEKTRKLLGALHRLPCMMSTLGVLPLPTILFFILCNSLFGYYLINVVPTFSSAWASAAQNIGYGILALGVFQVLQFVTGWGAAPTGKFNTGALALPVGLPVWLAWWTMEQPSVLVPAVALAGYFGNGGVLHPGVVYLGGMFIVHYIQRSFIYPFLQGTTGRDYPLHAWCFAMLFTACNGTMQANDLLYGPVAARSMADGLYANPRVYLGCAIWAFGLFCNVQADAILRNLRPPDPLRPRIAVTSFRAVGSSNTSPARTLSARSSSGVVTRSRAGRTRRCALPPSTGWASAPGPSPRTTGTSKSSVRTTPSTASG